MADPAGTPVDGGRWLRVRGWGAPLTDAHRAEGHEVVSVVDTVTGEHHTVMLSLRDVWPEAREALLDTGFETAEAMFNPPPTPRLREAQMFALREADFTMVPWGEGCMVSRFQAGVQAATSVEQVRDLLARQLDPFGAQRALYRVDEGLSHPFPVPEPKVMQVLARFDEDMARVVDEHPYRPPAPAQVWDTPMRRCALLALLAQVAQQVTADGTWPQLADRLSRLEPGDAESVYPDGRVLRAPGPLLDAALRSRHPDGDVMTHLDEGVFWAVAEGALEAPPYTVSTGPEGEFVANIVPAAHRLVRSAIAGDCRRRFMRQALDPMGPDGFAGMRVPYPGLQEVAGG